jgi:hypothetical protein
MRRPSTIKGLAPHLMSSARAMATRSRWLREISPMQAGRAATRSGLADTVREFMMDAVIERGQRTALLYLRELLCPHLPQTDTRAGEWCEHRAAHVL